MKNRRPALATTIVSAAVLALALAAPGTALAADDAEGKKGGSASENRPETSPDHQGRENAPEKQEREDDDKDEAGAGEGGDSAEAPRPQDAPNPRSSSAGKSEDAPASKGKSSSAPDGKEQGQSKAAQAPAPAGGDQAEADPPGNNGTIKISSLPVGEGRGNQPHPGCAFALVHYGFDTGQTADITFTHKAPTGSGETLLSLKGVTISDDAAGGGQDRDAVLTFTAADLGLTGPAPHRKGWHVKVAVDALEAPGGAKQKVFWLDCDGATGTGDTDTDTGDTDTGTGTGTGTGTDTGGTGGTGTGTTGADSGVSTGATEVLSGSLIRPLATSLVGSTGMSTRSDTAAGVLSTDLTRSAAPAAQAPAGSGALPSVLPFTGAGTIAFLFSLAVLALAAGGAFLRAGHRRAV